MKTLTTFACFVMLLSSPVARAQSSAPGPGDPVHTVSPKYPKDARKQKVEGQVTLHVTIAGDGSVKDVAVVRGDSRLTDAALAAVRKWRFQPFTADGKPVEGQRDVTINFTLSGDSVPLGPVFKVGEAGVTAPVLTYSRDPDYSEEARQARLVGTVLLSIVVAPDGSPRDIKVTRPLGSGLDEKAIEAIREWKFRPGTKDGQPVAVSLSVEVAFHLR